MIIPSSLGRADLVDARDGLALALKELASQMSHAELLRFLEFLIRDQALGDRSENVRQRMLEVGLASINANGTGSIQSILEVFELYLDTLRQVWSPTIVFASLQ